MPDIDDSPDDQDQSEIFDEDNFDAAQTGGAGPEFKTFEDLPEVLDVTRADGDGDEGDGDEDGFDEDDIDLDDTLGADGVEPEADAQYGDDGERLNQIDAESDGGRGRDEVELVYSGLMENAKGAQASAAHWEARTLSDDDIADLGYAPDADTDADTAHNQEKSR